MTGYLELCIFLCVIYWFFNESASTMIEVISAHMQNAYTGLRERSFGGAESGGGVGTPGADIRPGQAALRRFSAANKNKHFVDDRQIERLLKEKSLYRVLETPTSLAVNAVKRPFVGVSCSKCAPSSSVANKSDSQNVINILKLGYKLNQDSGFFGRTFCDFSQAYRAKKFDYKQVSETVMADERLKQALSQLTQETLDKQEAREAQSGDGAGDGVAVAMTPTKKRKRHVPRTSSSIYKELEKRARFILTDMRSTISDLLLRITSWTLYKVLPYFVTSVVASPDQLEVLRKAGDSGLPLIFVPLHRSHLDYILVSFILLNYNVQSPLVAAGDNLKIPLFGWLLRGLGAFYIKRNTGSEKDIMYKAALHTYMMHCLRARHNIEFFIEGGRSRTGKPQLPKGGILSVIVDAYLDGTIEDALLVPVSMNYEKLVDGNFVREQLGTPKQMETFGAAMKAIYKVLNSHYGSIRIDFNQPFSMRELVQSFRKPNQSAMYRTLSFEQHTFPPLAGQNPQPLTIKMLSYERTMTSNSSCASLFGTDCVSEDQKGLVEAIARHVVYDCTNATAIMSTNAVAFVLLTRFRSGCSLAELVTAVEGLTQELLLDGRSVGYIGDMVDVVNHAINILGPGLVIKENDSGSITVKPVSIVPNIIELSYYGNCLLPHYVIQSIVVTALEVLIAEQPSSGGLVSWKELMDMSLELCEILSQEFILCKPCQDLEDYVRESIHKVSCKDWIRVLEREDYSDDQMQGVRMSHSVLPMDCADDDYPVEAKVYYMVNRTDECATEKKYLQTVLQPLIDVYSVTAQCLPKLLTTENGRSTHMSEADFVREVIDELKQMLETGTCQYGEALSTDAIKNCLRLLRMWGVIDLHVKGRQRHISIAKQYHSHDKLKHIGDLIARFRTLTPPQQEQTDSQVKR